MISPDLQFSILCDDVRQEINGKFIFIGLFETISSSKFPVVHPRFFVVNRWSNGQGRYDQKVRIVLSSDNSVIIDNKAVEFELVDLDKTHTVISAFNNVLFPKAGKYWIENYLGDRLIRSYSLILTKRQK